MRERTAGVHQPRLRSIAVGWGGVIWLAMARPVAAQQLGPTLQPELRADVIAPHPLSGELALGVVVPTGEYLRLGGDLGVGAAGGDGRGTRLVGRADLYSRFHLDPYAESRWGPYLIGGGSYRIDARRSGRLFLLVGLGVEGPRSNGLVSAIELGLGGGVRLGVAVRRARKEAR